MLSPVLSYVLVASLGKIVVNFLITDCTDALIELLSHDQIWLWFARQKIGLS